MYVCSLFIILYSNSGSTGLLLLTLVQTLDLSERDIFSGDTIFSARVTGGSGCFKNLNMVLFFPDSLFL